MKRIILALLLSAASPAISQDFVPGTCDSYGRLAGKMMEARQAHIPLKESLKIVGMDPLLMRLVLVAYSSQIFDSQDAKKRMISGYDRIVVKQCLKQTS